MDGTGIPAHAYPNRPLALLVVETWTSLEAVYSSLSIPTPQLLTPQGKKNKNKNKNEERKKENQTNETRSVNLV